MANKYLKRKFTGREIVLLVVLAVVLFIGLYFALVYYPLRTANDDLDRQISKVDSDLVIAEALKSTYDRQKAAVEDFKENNTATMPKYDNNNQQIVLQTFFNGVLSGTNPSYNWSTVSQPTDGVRIRTVTFNFTVSNRGSAATVYDRAIEILHNMMHSNFRCSMATLNMSTRESTLENAASIDVQCTINFYELDA